MPRGFTRIVEGSVLWLLADNRWAQANMLRCAAEHGVDASRLIFAPRVAPPDYLARFTLADLFLDTFPYNAGTTASDALWMGTPIVTLSGRSYISRMAGSLLTAVGLPELATTSLADYETLALALAHDPERLDPPLAHRAKQVHRLMAGALSDARASTRAAAGCLPRWRRAAYRAPETSTRCASSRPPAR